MLFFLEVKLQKMLSTGDYATLWSFPAFTAVLCSTHVCTAVCMRVCMYAPSWGEGMFSNFETSPRPRQRQVLHSSLHHYVLPRSCPPPRQSSCMHQDSTSYGRLLYVLLGAVVCAAVQLSSWLLVTASLLYCCVLCMCVCVCAVFFCLLSFFFLILNSVLACCLLFAVCDKWVDFRGGDAEQQCNALSMFLCVIYCTSIMYHTLQTWHASSIIA